MPLIPGPTEPRVAQTEMTSAPAPASTPGETASPPPESHALPPAVPVTADDDTQQQQPAAPHTPVSAPEEAPVEPAVAPAGTPVPVTMSNTTVVPPAVEPSQPPAPHTAPAAPAAADDDAPWEPTASLGPPSPEPAQPLALGDTSASQPPAPLAAPAASPILPVGALPLADDDLPRPHEPTRGRAATVAAPPVIVPAAVTTPDAALELTRATSRSSTAAQSKTDNLRPPLTRGRSATVTHDAAQHGAASRRRARSAERTATTAPEATARAPAIGPTTRLASTRAGTVLRTSHRDSQH